MCPTQKSCSVVVVVRCAREIDRSSSLISQRRRRQSPRNEDDSFRRGSDSHASEAPSLPGRGRRRVPSGSVMLSGMHRRRRRRRRRGMAELVIFFAVQSHRRTEEKPPPMIIYLPNDSDFCHRSVGRSDRRRILLLRVWTLP